MVYRSAIRARSRAARIALPALLGALVACDAETASVDAGQDAAADVHDASPDDANAADARADAGAADARARDGDAPDAADADASEAGLQLAEIVALRRQLDACAALSDSLPEVVDVQSAVARINAMPHPVELPCFLASLPRPLSLVATVGTISAQPAYGRRSPRLFLMSEGLVMSVVPDGPGAHLLEFGEVVEPGRTLKGEVEFPVTAALEPDAAFTRVRFDDRLTTCGFCHAAEVAHPDIAAGFVSMALQPELQELVPVEELRAEFQACDFAGEPERCAQLTGLFAYGDVVQGQFDDSFEFFF